MNELATIFVIIIASLFTIAFVIITSKLENCDEQKADKIIELENCDEQKFDKIIENFFKNVKNMTSLQKVTLCFNLFAAVLLVFVVADKYDFSFIFLKIIVSASMICLLLEKFPVWYKFIIGLNLILYNPIIQISMRRWEWEKFDWITLILIILSLIIFFVKLYKSSDRSENSDPSVNS